MQQRLWTREEFMLVMNLYAKIPYGKFHARNSDVIKLANILNRTPGAVAYKLVHFASLDPYHKSRGIKGLGNPGNNAIEIFNEFQANWDSLIYESEILLAKYQNKKVENIIDDNSSYLTSIIEKEGLDKERKIKTRVNQYLFRKIILNNYYNKCTVCGLNVSNLLIASHILKWSECKKERLNPTNGLCLCPIHDKAFELGYMGIDQNYKLKFSSKLYDIKNQETIEAFFLRHNEQEILMPDKYFPNKKFLSIHFTDVYQK